MIRGQETYINSTLVVETCFSCGLAFGLAKGFRDNKIQDHSDFYCPNGHVQHYTGQSHKVRAEEYKAEMQRYIKERNVERAEKWRQERLKENANKRALKLKKRIAAGVCPCCNRTVSQLANHIKTKHPTYKKVK